MRHLASNTTTSLFHLFCLLTSLIATTGHAQTSILNLDQELQKQSFWANRDFDWYKINIPFFDCPDEQIVTTYYYRWELVTRHLTYGSPNTGYTLTEFANRPFWSGRYGAIACPSGHQAYEIRWLRNPTYSRDFLHYWFRTPGAQPHNYSSWLADSAWATHLVHPDDSWMIDLYPDLTQYHQTWRDRKWVSDVGLYWQLGHDDGMEFDINAQQTHDILRGGQSLRPSFNAYMWADAQALAQIAELAHDKDSALAYRKHAEQIKQNLQDKLWDPTREFFFPMSQQRHEKDGYVVEKHTLTYQTGQFAGNPHGRELHGYVPWAFGMPDKGYEAAWRFLMDADYFQSTFGPTTVEQQDPLFTLKDGCCWWSGQSWPFATTQTLKAMAQVLHHYPQDYITKANYTDLLHQFAISHRKDGRPYIAEALNPFNGSWHAHDMPNRSEHYFHSGFVDLVITGLIGFQPRQDNQIIIDPLVPDSWPYFALQNIPYKGHLLTIVWDQKGDQYSIQPGLHLYIDNQKIAHQPKLQPLTAQLPKTNTIKSTHHVETNQRLLNYAVNNDGDYYPKYTASFVASNSSLADISDGQRRYDSQPSNRWTNQDSPNTSDWIQIDLGQPRTIQLIQLYLIDELTQRYAQTSRPISLPQTINLFYQNEDEPYRLLPITSPIKPLGNQPTSITCEPTSFQRLRVQFTSDPNQAIGLTEIELWGPGQLPYTPPLPPIGNLAISHDLDRKTQASASFSDPYGGIPERVNDGKISYQSSPSNRWTSYGSPNEKDWLQIDLGRPLKVSRVEILIYDDRGGVQAPISYDIEYWDGKNWQPVQHISKHPAIPTGNMANVARFEQVTCSKIRAIFTHKGVWRSGVTEMEVWESHE